MFQRQKHVFYISTDNNRSLSRADWGSMDCMIVPLNSPVTIIQTLLTYLHRDEATIHHAQTLR